MPKRKRISRADASHDELTMSQPSRVLRARAIHQKSRTTTPSSLYANFESTKHVDALNLPPTKARAVSKSTKSPRIAGRTTDQASTVSLLAAKTSAVVSKAQKTRSKPISDEVAGGVADSLADNVDNKGKEESEAHREARERPPAVNSDYLPLPWKGRLGYACLCTYLRTAKPSFFCSRTTRIASILEHRHPLADPNQPEHPIKNRPDKNQPADPQLGQEFVERLGLANCRDMVKLLRWNEKYGIKFMRLSSEAFPFASHAEYGYKLAPFASDVLRDVGKVVTELGHRVTTHPGQFTQLGSPHKSVIDASIRDLAYHDEMLSLLKLPPQQDRDAVMVIHMGGVYGDKSSTLSRFKANYSALSKTVKARLVLENDDVSWHVHDLLPVCEELNIPLVLDFHHHNIIFDSSQVREGTKDIIDLFPRIAKTWRRKNITQKMHYSEPEPHAVTPRERRKHSPRVATLPPCPNNMDLMIEAKDKEQAVFELMRIFKLPGHNTFNEMIPHVREDERDTTRQPRTKKPANDSIEVPICNSQDSLLEVPLGAIAAEDIGMGGKEGRVYWPPGMEHWLTPQKRRGLNGSANTDSPSSASIEAKGTSLEDGGNIVKSRGRARKSKSSSNRDKL